MKRLLLLCLCFDVTAAVALAQAQKGANLPRGVSLIQLIASPEKYSGTRVMLLGGLALENEGDAVYLDIADHSSSAIANFRRCTTACLTWRRIERYFAIAHAFCGGKICFVLFSEQNRGRLDIFAKLRAPSAGDLIQLFRAPNRT